MVMLGRDGCYFHPTQCCPQSKPQSNIRVSDCMCGHSHSSGMLRQPRNAVAAGVRWMENTQLLKFLSFQISRYGVILMVET